MDGFSLVAKVLDPAADGMSYPVRGVKPRDGIKRWMLDAPAAAAIAESGIVNDVRLSSIVPPRRASV